MCNECFFTDNEDDFLYSDEALDIIVEAMRVHLSFATL